MALGMHKPPRCRSGIFDICFRKTDAREAGGVPGGGKRPSGGQNALKCDPEQNQGGEGGSGGKGQQGTGAAEQGGEEEGRAGGLPAWRQQRRELGARPTGCNKNLGETGCVFQQLV